MNPGLFRKKKGKEQAGFFVFRGEEKPGDWQNSLKEGFIRERKKGHERSTGGQSKTVCERGEKEGDMMKPRPVGGEVEAQRKAYPCQTPRVRRRVDELSR